MIIFMLGLIVIAIMSNMAFYEFYVIKHIHDEPKNITNNYTNYLLIRKYVK
jgi:hypothetical protein